VVEIDAFKRDTQLLGYLLKCVIEKHVNLQRSTGVLPLNVDTHYVPLFGLLVLERVFLLFL